MSSATGGVAPAGRGKLAEDFALEFLRQKSFQLIERNFRCKGGEIDLVMMDAQDLVFIEVRYRRSSAYGDGAESVDYFKQRKLRIAAETWLQRNQSATFKGCRFDVMSLSGYPPEFSVEWIGDAF